MRGSGLLAGQSSMGIRKPTLVAAGGFNRSRFAKIKPEQILQLSNRIDKAKILNILDN